MRISYWAFFWCRFHVRVLVSRFYFIYIVVWGFHLSGVFSLSFDSFQAFLEFLDEQAAVTMVSFHQQNPAQIRMRSVYVQFSNHKELKTDQANSFQV